jgi:hypothetical protein
MLSLEQRVILSTASYYSLNLTGMRVAKGQRRVNGEAHSPQNFA